MLLRQLRGNISPVYGNINDDHGQKENVEGSSTHEEHILTERDVTCHIMPLDTYICRDFDLGSEKVPTTNRIDLKAKEIAMLAR